MKNNIIGRRIHFLRKEAGLTMRQLGEKIGFKGSTADVRLCQYESGDRVPKNKLLKKIAEELQVTPDTLLPPDYDTADGLMHTLFMLDDIYEFTPSINPEGDRIILYLNNPIENKQLQKEVKYATAMWVLAAQLMDYRLISYKDYQKWKHNYPNVNLFELVLGYPVEPEAFFDFCKTVLDIQLSIYAKSIGATSDGDSESSDHHEQK